MKNVLLIGAGAQGNVICNILSQADDIGKIILGDIDMERANEVAKFISSPKVKVTKVDATNITELASIIEKNHCDLLVNATLPIFNRPILEACAKARTNYLDMASNEMLESLTGTSKQDEFLVEQLEFMDDFKSAERQALILAGGDSGLVNIMAKEAADDLDEVEYIGIKDYGIVQCDRPVALWSMATYLDDCSKPGVYWEDGQYKYAPIFSGGEEYYFPEPLNHTGKVYYHNHEEPVTIPKFIGKPIKYCDFKLGDPDSQMWRYIIEGLGMMDEQPIDINGTKVRPKDILLKKIPPTLSPHECIDLVRNKKINSQLVLAVDVIGTKNGKKQHYKMWTDSPNIVKACEKIPGTNDVSWITSVPASILSLMLLRGQVKHPAGVFPCEVLGKEERKIFFEEIKKWDIKIHVQISTVI